MNIENLSNQEKLVIAEFIHAMETDTLIKSEGQAVIDLFAEKGIERAKTTELETYSIFFLIKSEIEVIDRQIIMNEYLTGKL